MNLSDRSKQNISTVTIHYDFVKNPLGRRLHCPSYGPTWLKCLVMTPTTKLPGKMWFREKPFSSKRGKPAAENCSSSGVPHDPELGH